MALINYSISNRQCFFNGIFRNCHVWVWQHMYYGIQTWPEIVTERPPSMERPIYAVEITHTGDATKAAVKWTYWEKEFGGTFAAVGLGKDTLYSIGDNGVFVCLNPKTGKEFWRCDLEKQPKQFGAPVVNNGRVYVAAGNELSIFEDSQTRNLIGRLEFKDVIMGSPVIKDDRMYLATRGQLICVRLP